jgi:hypothetical protein
MTTLGTYDIGDQPVITAEFRDLAGVLADPTAVTFMLRRDSTAEASYVHGTDDEVDKTSTGIYTFTVPVLAAAGRYVVRSKGTGAVVTASETAFQVRPSGMASP